MNTCPWSDCDALLEGLERFCHHCMRYADMADAEDAEGIETPSSRAGLVHQSSETHHLPDTRSEKEIEAGIIELAKSLGYHVSKLSQPRNTMQTPGIPDLWVMGHGKGAWIEVKREKGQLSMHQKDWHREARANGVEVLLFRNEAQFMAWHGGHANV